MLVEGNGTRGQWRREVLETSLAIRDSTKGFRRRD
jgi:hypothetical protein